MKGWMAMWQKDTEEISMFNIGHLYSGTNVSVGQMSRWDKCPSGTNVPVGQMSKWDKFPVGQISSGTNVSGTTVSGTNVCGTNVTPPIFKMYTFICITYYVTSCLTIIVINTHNKKSTNRA